MRMLKILMPVVAMVLCLSSARSEPVEPAWPSRPAAGMTLPCKVINVVDGDTLDVQVVQLVRVRLLECWAPESRTLNLKEKQRGLASKRNLHAMANAKSATVWIPIGGAFRDSLTLDRVLGHVWIEGQAASLSEMQVAVGHAYRTRPQEPAPVDM